MENTKKKNTFINRRIPLASMLYVKIAERFVTGKGMDCSVINKMSNKGDETPKLPLKDVLDFWEKAAVLIKDEALGLSIGINSHLTDYGMISHILMNSQNLYKALKLIDFYRYLMNECFESKLFCKGNIVHYKLDFTYEHPASYHLIEFHFSSIIHLGKQIARVNKKHDISPYKVEFSHAPKAPIKEYQRIFGENIKFNQNKNSLLFLNETLLISTHSPNEE
ncbi:AraC family transcriptional regulator ligand-binding domain-containing protein, partial [Colwellia psychrerythraea]